MAKQSKLEILLNFLLNRKGIDDAKAAMKDAGNAAADANDKAADSSDKAAAAVEKQRSVWQRLKDGFRAWGEEIKAAYSGTENAANKAGDAAEKSQKKAKSEAEKNNRELEKQKTIYESLAGAVESFGARAKKVLAGLAAGAIATAAAGIWQLTKALKEFASQELGEADVVSALKAMGQYTDEYREKLFNLANQYQKTTGIADDMWLKAAGQLTRFGMNAGNVDQVFNALKNLAGLMDGNFDTALSAMSRAMEGEFGMFSRYGIVIETTGDKITDLNNLMLMLEQKGAGLLEARAETLAGKWQSLKNAISDFREEIGRTVTEASGLKDGLQWLAEKFDQLTESAKSGKLHEILSDAADKVRQFAENISAVIEQIHSFDDLKAVLSEVGIIIKEQLEAAAGAFLAYIAEKAPGVFVDVMEAAIKIAGSSFGKYALSRTNPLTIAKEIGGFGLGVGKNTLERLTKKEADEETEKTESIWDRLKTGSAKTASEKSSIGNQQSAIGNAPSASMLPAPGSTLHAPGFSSPGSIAEIVKESGETTERTGEEFHKTAEKLETASTAAEDAAGVAVQASEKQGLFNEQMIDALQRVEQSTLGMTDRQRVLTGDPDDAREVRSGKKSGEDDEFQKMLKKTAGITAEALAAVKRSIQNSDSTFTQIKELMQKWAGSLSTVTTALTTSMQHQSSMAGILDAVLIQQIHLQDEIDSLWSIVESMQS